MITIPEPPLPPFELPPDVVEAPPPPPPVLAAPFSPGLFKLGTPPLPPPPMPPSA